MDAKADVGVEKLKEFMPPKGGTKQPLLTFISGNMDFEKTDRSTTTASNINHFLLSVQLVCACLVLKVNNLIQDLIHIS